MSHSFRTFQGSLVTVALLLSLLMAGCQPITLPADHATITGVTTIDIYHYMN